MKKQVKTFCFDTQIAAKFGANKGKIVAHARISGRAEYRGEHEFIDTDYIDFDDVRVILQRHNIEADATLAYQVEKAMGGGDLSDLIDEVMKAHMEYLFDPQYSQHPEVDHTDTVQDMPDLFYGVTAVAKAHEGNVIVEPVKNVA